MALHDTDTPLIGCAIRATAGLRAEAAVAAALASAGCAGSVQCSERVCAESLHVLGFVPDE